MKLLKNITGEQQRSLPDYDPERTEICNDAVRVAGGETRQKLTENFDAAVAKALYTGGTLHIDGSKPVFGFAWCRWPERAVVLPVSSRQEALDAVRGYIEDNRVLLSRSDVFLGLATGLNPEGDDPEVRLNISEVTLDASEARRGCVDKDQKTFWDIGLNERVVVNWTATSGMREVAVTDKTAADG